MINKEKRVLNFSLTKHKFELTLEYKNQLNDTAQTHFFNNVIKQEKNIGEKKTSNQNIFTYFSATLNHCFLSVIFFSRMFSSTNLNS